MYIFIFIYIYNGKYLYIIEKYVLVVCVYLASY